jgi:ceramide glucosyltransferase
MIVAHIILLVALAGLISSIGFLVLIIVAAARFQRRQRAERELTSDLPPVTILKPLCGSEPALEANLASFFEQDYPEYEIVFGARDDRDPAIEIARKVSARYAHIPVRFVFSGEPEWPNAKIWSLQKMAGVMSNDYLVLSDSDVHVTPAYLREVVRPLLDPKVGLVTCVYRGVTAGSIWSRMEALGLSVEMTAGVVVADMLEGMTFALGPTMATRKDVLEAIGGFKALSDFYADDYVLGNEVFKSGRTVVLSTHVIDNVLFYQSFKSSISHQVRWMRSTRFSRPAGHFSTVLTFAMPFGLLGLLAGLCSGHWAIGLAMFGFAFVNRVVMSVAAGWGVVRDSYGLRDAWLYPLRDLMGFCWWAASYFSKDMVWRRGERYRFQIGGRMVRIGGAPNEDSRPVAVDHLS